MLVRFFSISHNSSVQNCDLLQKDTLPKDLNILVYLFKISPLPNQFSLLAGMAFLMLNLIISYLCLNVVFILIFGERYASLKTACKCVVLLTNFPASSLSFIVGTQCSKHTKLKLRFTFCLLFWLNLPIN